MSMLKPVFSALSCALLASCAFPLSQPFATPFGSLNIGRIASADEIRGWDIDISADGRGLPPGSGTAVQGRLVYDSKCASCHGPGGAGGPAPRLVGGVGSLTSRQPVRTVGSFWPYAPTVYDYVFRSMPWDKPMSLSSNEVYAVTAYLLQADGLVGPNDVMDSATLPRVRMPNRDGFIERSVDPDISSKRCMADCQK